MPVRGSRKTNPVKANIEKYISIILARKFGDPADDLEENPEVFRTQGIRNAKGAYWGGKDLAGGYWRDPIKSRGRFDQSAGEYRPKIRENKKKVRKTSK